MELAAKQPGRVRWGWAGALLLLTGVLLPADGWVMDRLRGREPGGDVKRELLMLQQYGQFAATVVISLAIFLHDRGNRRWLIDWWLALGATFLACQLLKMFFGRARPDLALPWSFTFPWQVFDDLEGNRRMGVAAWDITGNGVAGLWSMPSSHTAAAVVMTLFLCRLYPRLAPLLVALTLLVALSRVVFVDHYPSDTAAGAALALVVAGAVLHKVPRVALT